MGAGQRKYLWGMIRCTGHGKFSICVPWAIVSTWIRTQWAIKVTAEQVLSYPFSTSKVDKKSHSAMSTKYEISQERREQRERTLFLHPRYHDDTEPGVLQPRINHYWRLRWLLRTCWHNNHRPFCNSIPNLLDNKLKWIVNIHGCATQAGLSV